MTAVDLNSVRAHVEVLRWCKQRKAEVKELEERARAEVEAALGDAETGLLDGDLAVSWRFSKRRQLDQQALKSEHPEIVAEYTKTVEVRRFEVLDD